MPRDRYFDQARSASDFKTLALLHEGFGPNLLPKEHARDLAAILNGKVHCRKRYDQEL